MAKKRAKKAGAKKTRKAARSRSAEGRKGVDTSGAIKAMQKVLDELKEAKRGPTGWDPIDYIRVGSAERKLKLMMMKIKCPPGATQSFP